MEAQELKATTLKWQGSATAKLLRATADAVWPLLADFFSLHKWLPTIDTCFKVDSSDGSLIRHCSATLPPPPDGGDPAVQWCREKLTAIDPAGKWLSYEVVDSNMGLRGYESTVRVSAVDGGVEGGCEIEWSFAADPVEGLSCEDLVKYVGIGLQGMALNMEKALEVEESLPTFI